MRIGGGGAAEDGEDTEVGDGCAEDEGGDAF